MNRIHNFVADILDIKYMGLRLRDHLELTDRTQKRTRCVQHVIRVAEVSDIGDRVYERL